MSQLVEERLVYFKGMAEAKGVRIMQEITENVVLTIDRNDALRLVDNLLSNAIKYNKPNGTLTIVLNTQMLSVSDTGIGIRKRDLETILQRFKRANKSEGGFGIGLDIVNQVVRNYGFTLKIDSMVNKGTRVRVLWA
jgi:two-component system OmpR family sensor kinase